MMDLLGGWYIFSVLHVLIWWRTDATVYTALAQYKDVDWLGVRRTSGL